MSDLKFQHRKKLSIFGESREKVNIMFLEFKCYDSKSLFIFVINEWQQNKKVKNGVTLIYSFEFR